MATIVSTVVVVIASVVSTLLNALWHNRTVFMPVVSTIVPATVIQISTTTSLRIV